MKWSIVLAWLLSWALAPAPLLASDQFFSHSYAVVIGIDHYPHFRQLRNAVSDARAIADYLRAQNYDQVITLYDQQATKQAIIAAMQNQLAPRLKSNDRVLVFFAGHGYTETLGGKDRGYFVPYDGETQSAGYISMEELLSLADYMGNARHLLFIMDSCYGGLLGAETRGSLVNPDTPDYLSNVADRVTRQVLTAGGKGQEVVDGGSKGHSVFVDAILEALADGKADMNRNGYITFAELSDYVMQRASNRYQTPLASVLPGNQGGEYLFRSPLSRAARLASGNESASGALRGAVPGTAASASATAASNAVTPAGAGEGKNLLTATAIRKISVAVLDNQGRLIPNLWQGNFRVFEDSAPRSIVDFHEGGPATVAILIQFNTPLQQYSSALIGLAGSLIDILGPKDWIALAVFDMHPKIITDFSLDHASLHAALSQHLGSPGFSEANLYDALGDLENRMKSFPGQKAIIVFTDGVDTFSKLTLDKVVPQVGTAGVPIYAIRLDTPAWHSASNQADDILRTLASQAGGQAFFPGKPEEFSAAFRAIDGVLHGYQILYQRTSEQPASGNSNVTVQLVSTQNSEPMRIVDQSGAEIQYRVVVTQMP